MGKSKKNRAASQNQTQHKSQTSAEAFSFGDPIPVLDRRELLDYVESAHSCPHVLPVAPDCGAVRMHDRLHQNVDVWKLGNQTWFSTPNLSQNRTQRLIAKIDVY